ncbi:MAG: UPF0149 family protein [Vibrio sp.]
MTLEELISEFELDDQLLNAAQTKGFVLAMAAAPYPIDPSAWLPYLWGGTEQSPFQTHEQLEQYAHVIADEWNKARPALLGNTWQWPNDCTLDEEEIVSEAAREFCEGFLQGWQLARDDWETIMPEDSEDNALLGGVLLSVSMLYDPQTALTTLQEEGMDGLDTFKEIYQAMPTMLCGLTQRGVMLTEQE